MFRRPEPDGAAPSAMPPPPYSFAAAAPPACEEPPPPRAADGTAPAALSPAGQPPPNVVAESGAVNPQHNTVHVAREMTLLLDRSKRVTGPHRVIGYLSLCGVIALTESVSVTDWFLSA